MIKKIFFALLLGTSTIFADPVECMDEATINQIQPKIKNGAILYRDCYFCSEPAFEKIQIIKSEIRKCHLAGSENERAIYTSGVVVERFQMPTCNKMEEKKLTFKYITDELLVLNYSYINDGGNNLFKNIVDLLGGKSFHSCTSFDAGSQ
ncbi:MAG TPA: hypothetical protein PLY93_05425 [Turneriella sp.]|nr:hypothetical protein [Turneriella sp.]